MIDQRQQPRQAIAKCEHLLLLNEMDLLMTLYYIAEKIHYNCNVKVVPSPTLERTIRLP